MVLIATILSKIFHKLDALTQLKKPSCSKAKKIEEKQHVVVKQLPEPQVQQQQPPVKKSKEQRK